MEQGKSEKNDWENNDDWDDWEDAEDDTKTNQDNSKAIQDNSKTNQNNLKQQKSNDTTTNSKESEDNQANHQNNLKQQKSNDSLASPEESSNKNSSWASMFKPFGGVVTSITSTVSQGINQVIGVPDPEELARINAAEAAKARETNTTTEEVFVEEKESPTFSLGLMTTLGSKVLNTGLDTLEGIGKKTMTMLQENDPLLMNKRKLLGLESERPNLSAVLQEAKKDADQIEQTLKQLQVEKLKISLRFESLFENNCGLVHLEALEILSKESTLKMEKLLDAVSGQALRELKETINEVKELMELEDLEGESEGLYTTEELKEQLSTAVEDADFNVNFEDIVSNWSQTLVWFEASSEERTAEDIFTKGITTLAETCALEMNKLHKIAELLLVKDHHSTANEVDGLVQLCKQFTSHLNGLTNRFATSLTATNGDEEAKNYTSTIFSDLILATQQVEKAFKLFLPILQIGAA